MDKRQARSEHSRPSQGVVLERLLQGDETLFGIAPSRIAQMVEAKLNSITSSGRVVRAVFPIPDSHVMGLDGGVKDISFVTVEGVGQAFQWETKTLLPDSGTFYTQNPDYINGEVEKAWRQLEADGYKVEHIVPITDSHRLVRYSGKDGVKNFIICYHR